LIAEVAAIDAATRLAEERQLKAEQDAAFRLAEERPRQRVAEEERAAVAAEFVVEANLASAEQRRLEGLERSVLSNGAPVALPIELIRKWTRNFSQELDRGAFGVVYKGFVTTARGETEEEATMTTGGFTRRACSVAVKNFNMDAIGVVSMVAGSGGDTAAKKDATRFIESVLREIRVLSSFNHPNIIRLVGYSLPSEEQCRDRDGGAKHASLVYECADRGGLHKMLQNDATAVELTWYHRIQVALGVAKGLSYMHHRDRDHPAYHRDIKAANVALTQAFVPKIIDCGLAKYVPEIKMESIHSATGARFGTVGYMCPKYCKTANLTYDAKCEVYAFGILLLELISGHVQGTLGDNLEDHLEEESLVPDARAGWPTAVTKGTDPVPPLLKLASECVKVYSKRRHDMRAVARELSAILQLNPTTALERSLLESQGQLAIELEELRLHRDAAKHSSHDEQHECAICCDPFSLRQGLLCGSGGEGKGHFLCSEDLNDMMLSQCRDLGSFVRFGCKVVCAMCAPGNPMEQRVLELSSLAPLVSCMSISRADTHS
jgi:serine/threonine protein kinase